MDGSCSLIFVEFSGLYLLPFTGKVLCHMFIIFLGTGVFEELHDIYLC